MTMRIGLLEEYSFVTTDTHEGRTCKHHVNMNPVWQMFIFLTRYGDKSKYFLLCDKFKIDESMVSIIERGVEKQIFLLHGDSFDPEKCQIPYNYLKHLKDISPDPSNPKTSYLKPNTCFFQDSTTMPITYPDDEYVTFNMGKTYHQPRYHIVCDLQGLVLGIYGPVKFSPVLNITMEMGNFADSLSLFKVDDEYLQLYSYWCDNGDATNFEQVTCRKIDTPRGPMSNEEENFNEQHRRYREISLRSFSYISKFWKDTLSNEGKIHSGADPEMTMRVSAFIANCYMIFRRANTDLTTLKPENSIYQFRSKKVLDLESYINQWILPEILMENAHTLRERLLEETEYPPREDMLDQREHFY